MEARSVVVVTRAGYIKRMPLDTGEFSESQGRGTRGKAGAKLTPGSGSTSGSGSGSGGSASSALVSAAAPSSFMPRDARTGIGNEAAGYPPNEEDEVLHFFTCNDHDSVLFITQRGVVHSLKAWQLPIGTRAARGAPLPTVLSLSASEATVVVGEWANPIPHQPKARTLQNGQRDDGAYLLVCFLISWPSSHFIWTRSPSREQLMHERTNERTNERTHDRTNHRLIDQGARAARVRLRRGAEAPGHVHKAGLDQEDAPLGVRITRGQEAWLDGHLPRGVRRAEVGEHM